MLPKKQHGSANASTGIFTSPKAQRAAGEEAIQMFYRTKSSMDFMPKAVSPELCHGSMQTLHDIGTRGCRMVKHPGQSVPLLNYSSVMSRRAFGEKPDVQSADNASLAKLFKAGVPHQTPNIKYDQVSQTHSVYKRLSPKDMRRARQSAAEDIEREAPPDLGSLVKTSLSQHTFGDPNGKMACIRGQTWTARNNIEVTSRKLDYWVSENKRGFKHEGDRRTKDQRAKDLDDLLADLKRQAVAPYSEEQ